MTASKQDQLLVDWFCIPERGEDTAKPMRERVKPSLVAGAVAFVERGQFCEGCQTWRAEDHPDRAPRTGRPLTLTDRHVLVALLVLGLLGEPPSLKRVSELLQYRLHTESRDLLGLPRAERVSAHAHYHRVARAYTRLCALFDPKVYPTHRRLTRAAVQAITDTFDPAVVARKQQRADWLANKILDLTVQMTPHELLGPWTGDITLDGTKLPVWGKHGHAGTKSAKPDDLMSPEVTAGFHAKSQDNRDKANTVGQTDKTEYTFAHEAHLALMTSTARTPVPPLIIAMSLDRPGVNPGRNALVALSSIAQRGYPTGDVVTDLGYSQQKVENYHNPTRTLGYEPIMMYKRKELGVQGTHNGILLIEGTLYGPCIPQPLIDASIDYANKVIDSATYTARLEQRRAYAARRKAHTPGKATYVVVCPAYGPNATATCPLKPPKHNSAARGHRKALTLIVNPPQHPPKICTNTTSVSVPDSFGAKFRQRLPYQTLEWRTAYAPPRNEMEGKNQYIKDAQYEDIGNPGIRRYRGYGKQLLAVAVLLAASNIRALRTFLSKTDATSGSPPPKPKKGRPKNPGLDAYRLDPTGPPRIVAEPTAA